VASALLEIERETGFAASRDNDRRQVMERIEDARSSSEALVWARGYAEEVRNDLRFTVDALKELVNWLSGLPGRKAILYVSDGLPMVPAQELFHAVDALHGGGSGAITESLGYDESRLFQELAAQANANRVTFYTIDAAGLRVDSSIDVENRTAQPISISSIDTHNLQAPLRYVADATGGMAIINRNKVLPALDQVATDFETYYSLGYQAPEAGRGRYHKIEVELRGNRRGLTVRHREGYRDKTVEARMTDGTMTALRFEIARNPIAARLEFGPATPKDGRHFTVPVEVRIPIGNLVLIPRAESHEARLRLFIAARDAEGDSSPVQQVTLPVSIPSREIERARGEDWVYRVELLMRGGPHLVAVGIRDELASSESFVTRSLTVGGAAPAAREGR
jgi:VWFA-related protein